jgi:hypothetical protein
LPRVQSFGQGLDRIHIEQSAIRVEHHRFDCHICIVLDELQPQAQLNLPFLKMNAALQKN